MNNLSLRPLLQMALTCVLVALACSFPATSQVPPAVESQKEVVVPPKEMESVQEIAPPKPGDPRAQPTNRVYVRVSTTGTLGPMGYIATPSLSSATQLAGVSPEALLASQNYNFPSIILYISAMPVVYVPKDGSKIDAAADADGRYPTWLDATFKMTALDDQNKPYSTDPCLDGSIQILGILPQQTVAANKDSAAAEAATAANNVAGALASFYPGVKTQVSAATSALNVLFQAIFPPKPVAYQYSYVDGNCNFGWFFRPNDSTGAGTTGQSSILGIQTGIILLKTDKKIKRLQVTGQSLSQWSKKATDSGSIYVGMPSAIPAFVLPDEKNIDYKHIADLSAFPALIPKSQALSILGMEGATDDVWVKFVSDNGLKTTPNNSAVTNVSLSNFLGVGKPAPAVQNPAPGAGAGH